MFGRADAHIGLASDGFAPQGGLDHALAGNGRAGRHDGEVGLLHLAGHQGLAEETSRGLGPRRENHAGGVAVQAVHQPRPLAAGLGESPEQLVKGVDLRSPALARQTRRLVQRQDLGVLVDHHAPHEGDLFRGQDDGPVDRAGLALGSGH